MSLGHRILGSGHWFGASVGCRGHRFLRAYPSAVIAMEIDLHIHCELCAIKSYFRGVVEPGMRVGFCSSLACKEGR